MHDHGYFSNLIWQIADLLRGPYRPPQYERVMLPMTVLRRFDCVLAPTKAKVLAEFKRRKGGKMKGKALDTVLNNIAGQRFHNRSSLDFDKLQGDPDNIAQHLTSYINGFSAEVRSIFVDYFDFGTEVVKMQEANILYLVVSKFRDVDLHPDQVPNEQMGLIFENLIRRFNELANETAGDHFTPREVIRLMVSLLFIHDDDLLATPGVVRTLLDPACGTGGMLAEAQNYLRDHHAEAQLYGYGQDYNNRAYAIAASDMLLKQVDHNGGGDNVRFGDSLTDDQFDGETFDYFITNPPFGVDWRKQQDEIKREHQSKGYAGRFGAGLPRVNDGALLFLLHMIDKFEPVRPEEHKHGSRLAIVFSGSPLFTGGAGSGESNIRRWIIENDWLEAIVALPEQMFYNTGIGTYIWIVANNKERRRKGKIQLLDARDLWTPGGSADSKRSLGDKRRHLSEEQITQIVRLYGRFRNGGRSKIFKNEDFGFTRVTVERPLRLRYQMTVDRKRAFLFDYPDLEDDVRAIQRALGSKPATDWNAVWERVAGLLHKRAARWTKAAQAAFRATFTEQDPEAEPVVAQTPALEPDPQLRDFENVPLLDDVDAYFEREVRPYVPDAWMDRSKDKVGYEINFNRHFFEFARPRALEDIDTDLSEAERTTVRLLKERRRAVVQAIQCPSARFPLVPLKRSVALRSERIDDRPDLPYIGLADIESHTGKLVVDLADIESGLASQSTGNFFDVGDVLFGKLRPSLAKAWIAEFSGQCTTEALVLTPVSIEPRFLKYTLLSSSFLDEVTASTFGSKMPRAEWPFIGGISVHTPDWTTQCALADYLDSEIASISAVEDRTRRTNVLLAERRSVLISNVLMGQMAAATGASGVPK